MPQEHQFESLSRLPTLDELIEDEGTARLLQERTEAALTMIIPQSDDQRLVSLLGIMPPAPLSDLPDATWAWFRLIDLVAGHPEGVTAKQLAKQLGEEHRHSNLAKALNHLAERGEVRKATRGAVRFFAKPYRRVLPLIMRQFPKRLPDQARDDFDMAVLSYQETPTPDGWRQVTEALVSLMRAIPKWPESVALSAGSDPEEWLRLLAGLEPPSYVLEDVDPLVEDLKAQIGRLVAENDDLRRQLDENLTTTNEQQARIELLEGRLEDLEAWWDSAGHALESEVLEGFLAGHGRGQLPEDVPDAEVSRVRALVLATRANRKAMLAIAAGLGDVYRTPTAHQRLTTLSFKDHPYDSLWRARVGNYRIVYGLLNNQVRLVVIGTRGEVYELAVHALRNKQL